MRVYVLGAGASKHAQYPLASELGKDLAAYIFSLVPDFSEGDEAGVGVTASDPDEDTRQRFLDGLEDCIANPLDSDFSRIGDNDSLTSAGGERGARRLVASGSADRTRQQQGSRWLAGCRSRDAELERLAAAIQDTIKREERRQAGRGEIFRLIWNLAQVGDFPQTPLPA